MALRIKSAQYHNVYISTLTELEQFITNLKKLLDKNYSLTIKCSTYQEDDVHNTLASCWRPSDITGCSSDRANTTLQLNV